MEQNFSLKQEISVSKMLKDHFQLNQLGLNYDNPKDFLRPLVSITSQFSGENSDNYRNPQSNSALKQSRLHHRGRITVIARAIANLSQTEPLYFSTGFIY